MAEETDSEERQSGTAPIKASLFFPESANLETDPIPAIGCALENVVKKGVRIYWRIRSGDLDPTNKFERAYLVAWRLSCEELCELLPAVGAWMDDQRACPSARWTVKAANELIKIGSFFHLLEREALEGWEEKHLNELEQQERFADLLTKVASRVDELAAVWQTAAHTRTPQDPKQGVSISTVQEQLEAEPVVLNSVAPSAAPNATTEGQEPPFVLTSDSKLLELASAGGLLLLFDLAKLLTAAETDSGPAGREAVRRLGQTLEKFEELLSAVLPLWRADRPARLSNLTQPSALHLVCALAWRGWFLAWRLLMVQPEDLPEGFWLHADVEGATSRFDALEQRWPVVRRLIRTGMPPIDSDALAADLHNETVAMLRSPLPSAPVPSPILGSKSRQLMAVLEATPPYYWKLTDEELIEYFDRAALSDTGRSGQEGGAPLTETSIRREGDFWHLHYGGEFFDYGVRGNQSITWLAKLLGAPNRLLTVADLRGDPEGKLAADSLLGEKPETDRDGIIAIKNDLEEIEALAQEFGWNESLETRKENALRRLKNPSKQLTSQLKKDHHNIATQIRAFLNEKLSKNMPMLASHLKASLKLEFPNFGYFPPVGTPSWET